MNNVFDKELNEFAVVNKVKKENMDWDKWIFYWLSEKGYMDIIKKDLYKTPEYDEITENYIHGIDTGVTKYDLFDDIREYIFRNLEIAVSDFDIEENLLRISNESCIKFILGDIQGGEPDGWVRPTVFIDVNIAKIKSF